MYESVTQRTPHQGEPIYSLIRNVVEGRWQPPKTHMPDLDPTFESIITRAMRLKPADRYPTVFELGKALFPFASTKVQRLYADYFTRPDAHTNPPKIDPNPLRIDLPVHSPATAVLPEQSVPDWQRQATRTSLPPARESQGGLPSALLVFPGSEGPSSPQFVARQSSRRLMLMMGIGAVAVLIALGLALFLMRTPKDGGAARPIPPTNQSSFQSIPPPTQPKPSVEGRTTPAKAVPIPETPPKVAPGTAEFPKAEPLDVGGEDSGKDSVRGKGKSRKRFTPSGHPIL
jgi:hypothetical protein